jgi:hypothetical protein
MINTLHIVSSHVLNTTRTYLSPALVLRACSCCCSSVRPHRRLIDRRFFSSVRPDDRVMAPSSPSQLLLQAVQVCTYDTPVTAWGSGGAGGLGLWGIRGTVLPVRECAYIRRLLPFLQSWCMCACPHVRMGRGVFPLVCANLNLSERTVRDLHFQTVTRMSALEGLYCLYTPEQFVRVL